MKSKFLRSGLFFDIRQYHRKWVDIKIKLNQILEDKIERKKLK